MIDPIYIIYTSIIIVYLIILSLAIYILIQGFICDDQTCRPFINAFEKKTDKEVALFLLDQLCEESLWPIAFIASSIIMFLLVAILPLTLCMSHLMIIFLISFISFYCITAFCVYHYVKPIKQYIIEYILS